MRTIWLSLLIGPLFAACADKPLDMSKPVYVTVSTAMGDVTVELYGDTPLHRDNFIRLCRSGAYDGVLFHRVIEGFVVQGGDPDSRKREPGVLYGGNDGGYTVPAEIRPGHFNKRGALIDAKAGDETNPERASAGTQFCFVQGRRMTDEELDEAEKQIKLPKGTLKSLKSAKKGHMTVKCASAKNAIGYRIQYSTDYKFKKGVKTVYSATTTKTIKGLKKGKRYYVKVCPYTVYDDGTRVFGQNSYVKTVVVKKK